MVTELFICAVNARTETIKDLWFYKPFRAKLIDELSRTINGRSVVRLVGRSFGRSVGRSVASRLDTRSTRHGQLDTCRVDRVSRRPCVELAIRLLFVFFSILLLFILWAGKTVYVATNVTLHLATLQQTRKQNIFHIINEFHHYW